MQPRNEFLLFWFSAEVSWVACDTLIEPSIQCLKVGDLKNKDAVKQIGKAGEISRTAAEEGDCVAVISDHGFDFIDIPKQVLVPPQDLVHFTLMDRFGQRRACLWIAPIPQFPIAVEDVVTPPLQLFSHRGFTGAGNAFDQIVSDSHVRVD